MPTFRHLPVLQLTDASHNFEQIETRPIWAEPGLENSWKNVSAAEQQVAYTRDVLGWVHMRGRVESGANEKRIFLLPAGFRPGGLIFVAIGALNGGTAVTASVSVSTTGEVVPYFTTITQIGLAGISFLAEN